jgi:hypothetical protein
VLSAITRAIKLRIVFITVDSILPGNFLQEAAIAHQDVDVSPHPKRKRSLITDANFLRSRSDCQAFQDQDRASESRASLFIGWQDLTT